MSDGSSGPSYFRYFHNRPSFHLVKMPDGRFRLASSLFLTQELSVNDGEKCSAEQTVERCEQKPCGVSSLPKAKFVELQLEVKPDPLPGNDAHCIVLGIKEKQAKQLLKASKVVVQHPDVNVVDGDGKAMVPASIAGTAPG